MMMTTTVVNEGWHKLDLITWCHDKNIASWLHRKLKSTRVAAVHEKMMSELVGEGDEQ